MADEKKETKAKTEEKKTVTPKVDKKAFVSRKLKAINLMDNAFLAERLAERLRRIK